MVIPQKPDEEPVPELPLLHRHVRSVILLVHAKMLEGCPHPTLRRLSSSESHPGQLIAELLGEHPHALASCSSSRLFLDGE